MAARHRERHRTERIGWLRATVLGANVGIVSTASLLLGVSAAHAGGASMMTGALRVTLWGSLAMGLTAGVGAILGTAVGIKPIVNGRGGRSAGGIQNCRHAKKHCHSRHYLSGIHLGFVSNRSPLPTAFLETVSIIPGQYSGDGIHLFARTKNPLFPFVIPAHHA